MFTRFSLRDYNFKLLITVIIAMICGVVMINSADSSFTPKQTIGIGPVSYTHLTLPTKRIV